MEVVIEGTPAYRVVWNGEGDYLDPLYATYHVTDERVVLLFETDRPRRQVRFQVPDVPSGRYPVKIYDGGEGGQHYTWELFKVSRGSSFPWAVTAAFAGAIGLVLLLGYGARRWIVHREPSRV
jgi:hypothetical protein